MAFCSRLTLLVTTLRSKIYISKELAKKIHLPRIIPYTHYRCLFIHISQIHGADAAMGAMGDIYGAKHLPTLAHLEWILNMGMKYIKKF